MKEEQLGDIFWEFANDGNDWETLMSYSNFIKAARKLEELINQQN